MEYIILLNYFIVCRRPEEENKKEEVLSLKEALAAEDLSSPVSYRF